jgi:hypothetical protein
MDALNVDSRAAAAKDARMHGNRSRVVLHWGKREGAVAFPSHFQFHR